MTKREPMRTCVGCREVKAKKDLLRVVAREGHVALDRTGRMPGRGAYICPSKSCLEQAIKRRAFERALRATVGEIESEVIEHESQRAS